MSKTKSIDFNKLEQLIDEKFEQLLSYDPSQRPLVQAAVVNATFQEQQLLNHLRTSGVKVTEVDMDWLYQNTITSGAGWWSLKESLRVPLLKKFHKEGQLLNLKDKYTIAKTDSDLNQFFAALITGQLTLPQIQQLSITQIQTLVQPVRWLYGITVGEEISSYCEYRLERGELISQFKKHTEHFKGRETELRRLKDFVFEMPSNNSRLKPPMLVYGIGGIGKSSLISKFILNEIANSEQSEHPFVYLDFDRAGLTVAEPVRLAIEALRQLMLQFPVTIGEDDPLRDAREDLITFADDRMGFDNAPSTKITQSSRGDTRGFILKSIYQRHFYRVEDKNILKQPVTIVLDSFEEAQYRSTEAELQNLLSFLEEISEYLPNLRLIIAGRSDLVVAPFRFELLEVKDFDSEAAEEYLIALGVSNEQIRHSIYDHVGGNPLNLKLSAALFHQLGDDPETLNTALPKIQVREQLIRRNLEHIPDLATRQIVMPGLLVRRITPELISKVLAPVSELQQVDSTQSEGIYEELSRLTFLTESREQQLFFRKDLRRALQPIISKERPAQVRKLHELAYQFYQKRSTLEEQASALYHRLFIEDPGFLEQERFNFNALRPYLEKDIQELPPSASSALSRHFNLRMNIEQPDQISQEEWERNKEQELQKSLEGGVTAQQLETLWAEVAKTSGNHRGYQYHRANLAIRLGFIEEATAAIDDINTSDYLLDQISLKLQQGNYHDRPDITEQAINQFLMAYNAKGWINFIPSTILFAKWAGLNAYENLINTKRLLEAFMSIFTMDNQDTRSRNILRLPLRYASLANNDNRWSPLQDLISFAKRASIPSANFEILLPMFEQAFHKAANDYKQTSQTTGYKQLKGQLLNLGLEDVNGRLYRQYRVLVSDISEPAIWSVTVHDIADFLMAWHNGNLKEAGVVFDISPPAKQEEAPSQQGDLATFQNKLKTMLAEGKIEKVLDALSDAGDNDFQNSVILLSGRYNRMQREQRKGLMPDGRVGIETARINQALLSLIDDLE